MGFRKRKRDTEAADIRPICRGQSSELSAARKPMLRPQAATTAAAVGPEGQRKPERADNDKSSCKRIESDGRVIFFAPTTVTETDLLVLHGPASQLSVVQEYLTVSFHDDKWVRKTQESVPPVSPLRRAPEIRIFPAIRQIRLFHLFHLIGPICPIRRSI
ncbi:MAG: hypothetical protein KDB23_04055 [Planctomycetales bacterium]|nr:hypothetical protein [Planctomycetales bacterium]